MTKPTSIDAVQQMLGDQGYVCDRALGTVVFLALSLAARCSSKARPAWARPRSPRPWPQPWAAA